MKNLNKATWALLTSLLFTACSQEDIITDNSSELKEGVTATVKGFETEYDTRTALTLDDENGLTFKWTEKDKVAVFGKTGMGQATMGVTVGDEPTTATFDCQSFQLQPTNSYCAYLPFSSSAEVDQTNSVAKVPVNYIGQKQVGNATTSHLGDYDYLVSDVCTPSSLNTCHFTFSHMGVALRLQITMPEAGNWKSVTLAAADGGQAFTTSAYLSLFSDTYGNQAVEPKETASSVTLNLSDGTNDYVSTTGESPVLTAWIMLAPTSYFNATDGKSMTVTVLSADGDSYVANITPKKNFKQGYAYSLDLTMKSLFLDSKFKVSDNKYVTFTTGNLQYNIATKTYQVAEEQWIRCGNAKGVYTLDSDGKHITATPYTTDSKILDLFAWGTANDPTYAYDASTELGSYYLGKNDEVGNPTENIQADNQSFNNGNDWGTVAATQISGLTGARTLTMDEWVGLVQNQYFAVATLTDNFTKGLVVFPNGMDESTAKGYLTTSSSPTVYIGTSSFSSMDVKLQSISKEKLKASGALFLPMGGQRGVNSKIQSYNSTGYYWSASSARTNGESAYLLQFSQNNIQKHDWNRRLSSSVRLAIDVTE